MNLACTGCGARYYTAASTSLAPLRRCSACGGELVPLDDSKQSADDTRDAVPNAPKRSSG